MIINIASYWVLLDTLLLEIMMWQKQTYFVAFKEWNLTLFLKKKESGGSDCTSVHLHMSKDCKQWAMEAQLYPLCVLSSVYPPLPSAHSAALLICLQPPSSFFFLLSVTLHVFFPLIRGFVVKMQYSFVFTIRWAGSEGCRNEDLIRAE